MTHAQSFHGKPRLVSLRAFFSTFTLVFAIAGCRPGPDDVAGQSRELSDPVRRANAVANLQRLYAAGLANANGDRNAAAPKAVADGSIAALSTTYVDHPEDVQNGGYILALLSEMRDVRGLPALIKGLEWRAEVSEEHAITAANTFPHMQLDAAQKGQVVQGIATSLARITNNRPVDNRLRIGFLKALGALGDARAIPALTEVVNRQSENQNFLINRLAAEQLAKVAGPESIPTFIRALFLFDVNNPGMRMNDVATQGLVRIGQPALAPLLATLRGENQEANQTATAYITAVRRRNAQAAAQMSREAILSNESAFALGQLGFREALAPLLAETRIAGEDSPTKQRIMGAAIALVSINREAGDTAGIRDALLSVHARVDAQAKNQLLVAMQHFGDPGLLPFLLGKAQRPRTGEDPNERILAFRAYALLALESELAPLRAILASEPEGDSRDGFLDFEPALAAARECNAELSCWTGKLTAAAVPVVQKATYMVSRLGRGNSAAITALIAQLGHSNTEIRGEALYALDFVATSGSAAAIEKLEELRTREEGQSRWEQIKSLAMAVSARLSTRH